MKKWIIMICILLILLLLLALTIAILLWKYTDNTTIQLTTYQITNSKIPAQFQGLRIAQIADLHNTEFGENNEELLSQLQEIEPGIIVFTGDQIDARRTNTDVIVDFAKEAVQIAPCYLVTGNHEGSIVGISQFQADLEAVGVTILVDQSLELQHNGASLTLLGLQDPSMNWDYLSLGSAQIIDRALSNLSWDTQSYSILLAHHPEHLDIYRNHGVDLVLSGHAHGGQIRLGDQGIIAPNQGLLPKYDGGVYTDGNTTMILSRGLGNSLFPWRVNNPPELVIVELNTET